MDNFKVHHAEIVGIENNNDSYQLPDHIDLSKMSKVYPIELIHFAGDRLIIREINNKKVHGIDLGGTSLGSTKGFIKVGDISPIPITLKASILRFVAEELAIGFTGLATINDVRTFELHAYSGTPFPFGTKEIIEFRVKEFFEKNGLYFVFHFNKMSASKMNVGNVEFLVVNKRDIFGFNFYLSKKE